MDFTKLAPRPGEAWEGEASAAAAGSSSSGHAPAAAGGKAYRVGGAVDLSTGANAVIFWVDFQLRAGGSTASNNILSTGPAPGNAPTYWRQAVRFLEGAAASADGKASGKTRASAWLDEERGVVELWAE